MKKVVIIGAGPAGLTAAYELLKNSQEYEVIILESSNQVGGISKTIEYQGNRMDLGGHRFFTKSPQVMNIWRELLPIQGKPAYDDKILNTEKNFLVNGADPFKTDDVFLIRNRVSRIYYLKKFFDYPITLSFKTIKNLGFINTIEAGCSYLKSCFIKRKEDSLENFYINRFGKKLYQMFFYEYTKKLWGRDPRAEVYLKSNNQQEDIFLEYYNLQHSLIKVEDFLTKYNFDILLLNEKDKIYNYLNEFASNYEEVYNDNKRFVYQRKDYIKE